jgi:hypothetical protein
MRKIVREIGLLGTLVVDEHGVTLAGHLRRLAALAEGIMEADCVVVEGITEAEKRAFILADNKLGLGSTWDIERVQLMLDEIVRLDVDLDLSLTGFDAAEIDQLRMDLAPEEKGPSPRDEAMPELRKGPAVSRRGDIIRLGTHRLVCGDSRDPWILLDADGKRASGDRHQRRAVQLGGAPDRWWWPPRSGWEGSSSH